MFFERLKAFAGTLRFRLLAWNTAVVLLMVLPTLVVVRQFFYRTIYDEFDQLLREDAEEIRLIFQKFYPRLSRVFQDLQLKVQSHANREWFAQVFDGQGTLLWASDNAPALAPPVALAEMPQFREQEPNRFLDQRIDPGGGPPLALRVGASLQGLHEDLTLLTRIVVVTGTLILVLAPLGGYWLALRATAPLAKIIQTTSGLRPANLGERLPLRGTGDELDQLSRTINGLLDRLATYVSHKHDVLANAAHELRSPLAAIRTSAEVALTKPRSSEEYTNLLADVMEECSGLETLINQLLLIAAGEAGTLVEHAAPVALAAIIRKSLAMFEGVAEAAGIQLQAPHLEPLVVRGEESHLWQVVNNLIDNGIRFTPPAGRVTVDLTADAVRHEAILSVTDTGSGIAADDLPRIFERFYQSDKARPRQPGSRRGTGLGLSICHVLVTALGGRITVDSTPGKGSTFRVFLPLVGSA